MTWLEPRKTAWTAGALPLLYSMSQKVEQNTILAIIVSLLLNDWILALALVQ